MRLSCAELGRPFSFTKTDEGLFLRQPGACKRTSDMHIGVRSTEEQKGNSMDYLRDRGTDEDRVDAPRHAPSLAWAGYLACAWAFVFAGLSIYWARGGTAGAATIGPAITTPVAAGEAGWIALLWATALLKALIGLVALALVRPWGRAIPRRLLLAGAWSACAVMALYEGAASLVQHGLMVAGAIGTPTGLGALALRWHLALWDPWWLLGGILLGLAAWGYQRRSRRSADRRADALG